ncbi:TonB-dependent receptor [Pelagicoccus sp. NFK12]|uniref:TonB-dependent receptor n=1 Tax=Pelagicoccus enzymogenes TaxID=2773457 RepID=A0A927F5K0_9BACT|nr:TonB-dependent receptor plug domain-containing protein [Pelagicoccus enzymogenes]MBD5778076.1 TonB-dependent receptor [Pelagicoccus enzymogenes]
MHRKATDNTAPDRQRSLRLACALGMIGFAPLAFSQDDADEEVFELSPFEVTGEDNEGYRASSTLAGTRIRTDLKDVGSAISVYTDEFLKDVGATDNTTLLQYTTNAEVGGTQGTYAGTGNGTDVEERAALQSPNSNNRVRGLSAAENTRDFFVSNIPWDGYNVTRVDVQRGANSILFGLGKPAGIINASLQDATYTNEGNATIRFGSYGSIRTSVNLNKVLIEDQLSVRVAALMDDRKFQQDPAFEDDHRAYIALRYEPNLFGNDSMKTTFKAKYETGDIEANRPRNVPPYDSVSAWFAPKEVSDSNPFGGMGKVLVSDLFDAERLRDKEEAGAEWQPYLGGGLYNVQQPYWIFDGGTGELQDVRGGFYNVGALNPDGSARGAGEGLIGKRYSGPFVGVNSLSGVADDLDLYLNEYGQYRSQTITDTGVFDYNNILIDGDTKREYENFDAINLEFQQTALNDRIGFQVIYDQQDYSRANQGLLGWRPRINMDILERWEDGSPNPNVGRPYIVTSSGGSGGSYETNREYLRATLFAELRADDFFDSDSLLAKILGKHRFNAVSSEEDFQTQSRSWQNNSTDQTWDAFWNGTDGSRSGINNRPPMSIIYLGDSLISTSSASMANIPGIQGRSFENTSANAYLFNPKWIAGGGVDPGAAWAGPSTLPAAAQLMFSDEAPEGGWTQASNPANYESWTRYPVGVVNNYGMGQNPDLLTDWKMDQRETSSIAGTWQGFLWDGALVTTLGWRQDEIKSREDVAEKIASNRGRLDLSPDAFGLPAQYEAGKILKDQSVSGGLVLHLNKILNDDPLPFNLSLTYNKSSNFEVGNVRSDLLGTPIDNPSGTSKDYGFVLSTKDQRYSLRAIKYKSEINLASSSLEAGALGDIIANGLQWRNIYLYDLGGYSYDTRDQPSYRNRASNYYSVGSDRKYEVEEDSPEELALEDSIIEAWNKIQGDLTASGFLDAWGITNVTPLDQLTNRSTYISDPAAWAPSNLDTVYQYSNSDTPPANFAVTSDTISEGYEFEAIANPTDNWRISFNMSKTEASNNNVGGELINDFIDYLDTELSGPAGDITRWGGNPVFSQMYLPWRANYVAMKLSEGTAVPELRKWRYNVVTNYSFKDGNLKGVGIGGSYRWQDKVGIGYPLVPEGDLFGFDIANPIYGPSEDFIDLWASYRKKLSDNIDWKIQINVKNAFADDSLIPISVQPDNETWAAARRAPVQEWMITNSFSF